MPFVVPGQQPYQKPQLQQPQAYQKPQLQTQPMQPPMMDSQTRRLDLPLQMTPYQPPQPSYGASLIQSNAGPQGGGAFTGPGFQQPQEQMLTPDVMPPPSPVPGWGQMDQLQMMPFRGGGGGFRGRGVGRGMYRQPMPYETSRENGRI